MKLKNLTKKEKILLIIIALVIIALIVFVFIKIFSNDSLKGEEIENMLRNNLELYNQENENNLWCLDTNKEGCIPNGELIISFDEISNFNKDIDLGDCLLADSQSLSIARGINGDYTYNARVICSKDFQDVDYNIATGEDFENENIYYETVK